MSEELKIILYKIHSILTELSCPADENLRKQLMDLFSCIYRLGVEHETKDK